MAAVEEICLKVAPYGHRVSAKKWGTLDGVGDNVVIALHGWLDNASSFDLIAPHLVAAGFCIYALDLPGHGKSEWSGMYDHAKMARSMHAFILAAGLKTPLLILAHSYGAQCAFALCAAAPSLVRRIVMLDEIGPPCRFAGIPESYLRGPSLEYFAAVAGITARQPRRLSSVDEAVSRRYKNHAPPYPKASEALGPPRWPLSREEVELILCERGVRRSSDGGAWEYSHDPQLQYDFSMRSGIPPLEVRKEMAKAITAQVLWVRTQSAREFLQFTYAADFTNLLVADVQGTHFVHLQNPKVVADLVRRFFQGDSSAGIPLEGAKSCL
ncbi:unnamed protein product [Polarella glacialis]|uniref:AB hydrolase-1 domain-containing protein n=1 Tax=Polarella glacialis TaxID=89957 RepID=A0A813KYA0_POLGL|nr:unnamed protein product [Polarella glacialis]